MKQITIDCSGCDSPRQLHEAIALAMAFPAWYGYNLDALYDCLTTVTEETEMTLANFPGRLPYSAGFLRVLQDAAQKNSHLNLILS